MIDFSTLNVNLPCAIGRGIIMGALGVLSYYAVTCPCYPIYLCHNATMWIGIGFFIGGVLVSNLDAPDKKVSYMYSVFVAIGTAVAIVALAKFYKYMSPVEKSE